MACEAAYFAKLLKEELHVNEIDISDLISVQTSSIIPLKIYCHLKCFRVFSFYPTANHAWPDSISRDCPYI